MLLFFTKTATITIDYIPKKQAIFCWSNCKPRLHIDGNLMYYVTSLFVVYLYIHYKANLFYKIEKKN